MKNKTKINFCLYKQKPVIYSFYPLIAKINLWLGRYVILGNYYTYNDEINLFLPSLWKVSKKNQEVFLLKFIYSLTHEHLHSEIKKELNNIPASKVEEEIVDKLLI